MQRILVVDDTESILILMYRILKDLGYEVETVSNASEALEKFKIESFDLVITDFNMPGMNGVELAGALKALQPKVPIILYTSDPNGKMSPAIDLVLPKPSWKPEIYNAIKIVLP